MCNSRHEDSKPIKAEGFGWKIFSPGNRPCFSFDSRYGQSRDGFTKWNRKLCSGDGFCFLMTKTEALRLLVGLQTKPSRDPDYDNHYIKKIQYRKGICKHQEDAMGADLYLTALCKEFRIVE